MPYCPFFSANCPESNGGDAGCAIWTDFGCCIIDKPGIPAEYSGVSPSIDVFILEIMSCGKEGADTRVIYSSADDGVIGTSNTLSDFVIYSLH